MKKLVNLLLGTIFISGICTKEAVNSYKACEREPFYAVSCANFPNQTVKGGEEAESLAFPSNTSVLAQNGISVNAKAAYVTDERGETEIFAHNPYLRLPIASMCKIMTLILTFEAIEEGRFQYEDKITVSQRAASMGGSQVFLEANGQYPVTELIKSVVVCSANDSCVALAEKISGSEEAFIQRMNDRATELGLSNTLFANCTGLPKEPQYSCAHDVAVMLKELISHEKYFSYGKVWMDKFEHPKGRYTEISNTNKLVRFYDGCDGGKTGFTSQAGFCLAATAKRDGARVVSVVIGGETSKSRFGDVSALFDYAFANYHQKQIVDPIQPLTKPITVDGGKKKTITAIPARASSVFCKRGEQTDITTEFVCNSQPKAPVKKGDALGEIRVYKEGILYDVVPVISLEKVGKATYFDRIRDVARGWNFR